MGRPQGATLVFVGPGMTSLEQVAAVAGRRGVPVTWIGYPLSWPRLLRVRSFVSRAVSADDPTGLARELRKVGVDRIADIQASEFVLADVVLAARAAGVSGPVLADLDRRLNLTDKLVMSRRLAAAGVRCPPVLDAAEVSGAEAAERLGLPLVVKGRLANGGTGVEIVRTLGQLDGTARRVAVFGGAIYERYVRGESLSYAASYDARGQVLHDAAYLTRRVGHDATAPPDRILTRDDPAVIAVGRAVVGCLGGHGLVNVNLIRDAEGAAWVHDVNLRPWGTLLALRAAEIDFVGDYLGVLGFGECAPVSRSPAAIGQYDVFPSAALGIARSDLSTACLLYARQLREYARWTGVPYLVAETVRSALFVARDRLRRRRQPEPAAVAGDGRRPPELS